MPGPKPDAHRGRAIHGAFIFCLAIIAIFDAPFEFVLADEPATSLRLALPDP